MIVRLPLPKQERLPHLKRGGYHSLAGAFEDGGM